MALKHNITGLLTTDSSVWDLTNGVNVASNNVLAYTIVIVILIISSYYVIRKTSDTAKGFVTGLFITNILTLVLYYAGKVYGTSFIPDILMLGISVLFVVSLAGIKYARYNKNEST